MDRLADHGLPSDPETEASLLGVLLLKPSLLDEIETATPEFSLPSHRTLYETMLDLRADGVPIDFVSVRGLLQDRGELERIGGATWIANLINGLPANNEQFYADRIRAKYLQRRTAQVANAILLHAIEPETTGPESVEYAEQAVAQLSDEAQGVHTGTIRSVGETTAEVIRDIESGAPTNAIPIGLREVDDKMLGLEPQTLTIVGARPGNGKTAFGLTLSLHCAERGLPVVFFSLEMSAASLGQRLLAMVAKVSLHNIRHRRVSSDELRRLKAAQHAVALLPLKIDDTRGLTANQVCSRMRRYKKHGGMDIALVDYLTRLRFSGRRDLRHELGDAAKAFKDSSGEFDIPVVALSQLSRASVKEGKPRYPQLSDLRESGNLEEDADNVLFVHRDEYYDRKPDNEGQADIIVSKQRQGPAPEFCKVAFLGDFVRFANLW